MESATGGWHHSHGKDRSPSHPATRHLAGFLAQQDFERGFIKAEVYKFADFLELLVLRRLARHVGALEPLEVDADTLAAVLATIDAAHRRIIVGNNEPVTYAPPPPWDASRDPLTGKRDATAEERDTLAEIAQITEKMKTHKGHLALLRAGLRDGIANSGVKAIGCESTAGKISASIAKSGRFTIRGL